MVAGCGSIVVGVICLHVSHRRSQEPTFPCGYVQIHVYVLAGLHVGLGAARYTDTCASSTSFRVSTAFCTLTCIICDHCLGTTMCFTRRAAFCPHPSPSIPRPIPRVCARFVLSFLSFSLSLSFSLVVSPSLSLIVLLSLSLSLALAAFCLVTMHVWIACSSRAAIQYILFVLTLIHRAVLSSRRRMVVRESGHCVCYVCRARL